MVKNDIVKKIVEATGISASEAHKSVDLMLDSIKKAILSGDRVEFRGFGIFYLRNKKLGVGRNPKTGEVIKIKEGKSIKFKPGKQLKDI